MLHCATRLCLLLLMAAALAGCKGSILSSYDLSHQVTPDYPLKYGTYVPVDKTGKPLEGTKPLTLARSAVEDGYLVDDVDDQGKPVKFSIRLFKVPEDSNIYIIQNSLPDGFDYYLGSVTDDAAEIRVYNVTKPKETPKYDYIRSLITEETHSVNLGKYRWDDTVDSVTHGSRDTYYVLREIVRNKLIDYTDAMLRFRRTGE